MAESKGDPFACMHLMGLAWRLQEWTRKHEGDFRPHQLVLDRVNAALDQIKSEDGFGPGGDPRGENDALFR